ncbi:hypothetical protein KIN20_005050 [Parelaphostrongylus tenuis]|uniref:Uncharacterized protein n=1 Tax=Parelaphostrongylus tenuis TaxID=148309 RepID=A0AAD5M1I5_PARTN|nr:hypothetical protein KIN20_005050 [Parelaphostrongylus tenuis]
MKSVPIVSQPYVLAGIGIKVLLGYQGAQKASIRTSSTERSEASLNEAYILPRSKPSLSRTSAFVHLISPLNPRSCVDIHFDHNKWK